MRNKLDNFLIALLWLTISILAVCFWFNIKFGFNIFSSAHWHHLAYMQASQNPVNPLFYISTVVSVIIIILGLYLLIKPKTRKIIYPIPPVTIPPRATQKNSISTPNSAPIQHPKTVPTASQNIATPQTQAAPAPQTTGVELNRPPRLNIAVTPRLSSGPLSTPSVTHQNTTGTSSVATAQQWPELQEIFTNAGYTIKKSPRIGTLQTNLFAIGTNETLWIGAVGVPTTALQAAVDTLNQIFLDTLEDITINVNAFILMAPDSASPGAPEILTFDTPGDLRNYMNEHKNPPLGEGDNGNFDAFSAYMSTVIEYIEKI